MNDSAIPSRDPLPMLHLRARGFAPLTWESDNRPKDNAESVIKVCGHSSQRQHGRCEMNHSSEARVSFLISSSDTAELFEFAEEVFNEMAPAVHVEVTFDGLGPIGFRRDDGKQYHLDQ